MFELFLKKKGIFAFVFSKVSWFAASTEEIFVVTSDLCIHSGGSIARIGFSCWVWVEVRVRI